MSATRCYIVPESMHGMRLDAALAQAGLFATRSQAAQVLQRDEVLVNGTAQPKKYCVNTGDVVIYPVVSNDACPLSLYGEDIALDIRYEDDDLIVLSKQVGLVCHPCDDHTHGTLVNALIYHCGADHLCNLQGENDRLGIVHRLDMNTSGLMLAAKTDAAGEALMRAIASRSVERHYMALVHGIIPHDTALIDAPIARSKSDRKRMSVRDCPQARSALTSLTVLRRYDAGERDDGFTLIDCKLFTGRTHQIRVHLEYVKHPLVGEPVYNAFAPYKGKECLELQRQFLHSYRIAFDHPQREQKLSFMDNLPRDLRRALSLLDQRTYSTTDAGARVFAELEHSPYPSIEACAVKEVSNV